MVIVLDNRGVGKSSRPNYPYTMDMVVDDIKNLLDYLKITRQVHLYGVSMGGMIVQNFAIKYPDKVKTLILCATAVKYNSKPLFEAFKLMEDMTPEQMFLTELPSLYSRSFRKKLSEDKELFGKIKYIRTNNPAKLQDFINQANIMDEHDTTQLSRKITQPTLIIVGNKDKIIPYSNSVALHENIPNSRLEVFKGLGHGVATEAADEVNNMIWNFIKEHLN